MRTTNTIRFSLTCLYGILPIWPFGYGIFHVISIIKTLAIQQFLHEQEKVRFYYAGQLDKFVHLSPQLSASSFTFALSELNNQTYILNIPSLITPQRFF